MGQRNLLAAFRTVDDAQKTRETLSKAGYHDMQIEQIDPYPGEGVEKVSNPITGQLDSLSEMALDADATSKSDAIMNAANEEASGMSDGNPFETEENVLLTVVTDDQHADTAQSIIQKFGGKI